VKTIEVYEAGDIVRVKDNWRDWRAGEEAEVCTAFFEGGSLFHHTSSTASHISGTMQCRPGRLLRHGLFAWNHTWGIQTSSFSSGGSVSSS
jgi:hypothetical protein